MKTKFMAGLIATLASLLFTVGSALLMVLVFDMDSDNKIVYAIAFGVIAIWAGLYKWLKPKDLPSDNPSDDIDIPARQS
jgi:predicted metal-binding membrane protein